MRSENVPKIALNAAKSSKFETNGNRDRHRRERSWWQIYTVSFKADVILRIGRVVRRMRSVCKRILSGMLWEISEQSLINVQLNTKCTVLTEFVQL